MAYNLNKNRARCPSCVVLLWLNYVRMSATYEAVNNTLYKLFTRDPRSPTLERQIKTTVLPKQVDVPKFLGWLWWRICFLFSYLFLILWLWGEAFQFPFFNKGKVNGGGGGGVWKVIRKVTLSINRPKKLSNKFNFPSARNSLHNNWLVSAVLKLCTRIRGNVSEYQTNSCYVNSPWGTDLERKL